MSVESISEEALLPFTLRRFREAPWRRGGLILLLAILALGSSLLATKWWPGELKLLYIEQAPAGLPDMAMMGSAGTALQSLGLAGGSDAALMPEILRSRSLVKKVLTDSFRLDGKSQPAWRWFTDKENLDEMGMRRLVKAFREGRLQAHHDARTDVVRLQVLAPDDELAAALANRMAELLNERLVANSIERAKRQRDFIEGRLVEVGAELRSAEWGLKTFREANRSIQASPSLRLEEGRKIRQVALNEQVFTTLTAQRELARVEEVRNLPVIDVLEPAEPAIEPSSPRIAFRVMAGIFLGFLIWLGLDALAYLRRLTGA